MDEADKINAKPKIDPSDKKEAAGGGS